MSFCTIVKENAIDFVEGSEKAEPAATGFVPEAVLSMKTAEELAQPMMVAAKKSREKMDRIGGAMLYFMGGLRA